MCVNDRYLTARMACDIWQITSTNCILIVVIFRVRRNRSAMSKIVAYIRASTDKQDHNNQKLEILEWAHKNEVKIDAFVEITMSSRKTSKQRRIDEVLQTLADSDALVVTELSRLGRSTPEVIMLINELVTRNIRVMILKQNLDISQHDMNSKIVITLFSLFAE